MRSRASRVANNSFCCAISRSSIDASELTSLTYTASFARRTAAAEALALGLFDRVVTHARLAAEAQALAEAWATQPPAAVRRVKQAMYLSASSTLASMLDWEIVQQKELFATPEVRERIAGGASLTKRSG